jgi:hypothetical protein
MGAAVRCFDMLSRMGKIIAEFGFLLGICFCTAHAAVPVETAAAQVTLEGQRKFLNASIALCIERVPALKAELANARDRAEPQIYKAEGIIREQIAATVKRDRPLLDKYIAMWSKNADDLLEALKKQSAEGACPTLRDNWLAIEADVIVEDWQNYLDNNLQAAE